MAENQKKNNGMLTRRRLSGWLRAPQFDSPEITRKGRLLHLLLLVLIGLTLFTYIGATMSPDPAQAYIVVTLTLGVLVLCYILMRKGRVRLAAGIMVIVLWVSVVGTVMVSGGIGNTPYISLILVATIATLLLGGPAGLLFAGISAAAGAVFLILELGGLLPQPFIVYDPFGFWITMTVVFLANAGLIYLANRSLDDALKRAHQNERAQIEINRELEAVRASLEHQVIQRTQDLETRSSYLLSTTEISRTVASILDIELLLQQTVNLMQEKFNLYYVGLFLVDSKDEWADLQAGTGKAGQAMLNRSHRIRVGNGMIGWSIANSRPRVAQEINADDMHLATPELPETRSEASIPLRSRGNVLGAISVQSTRPDAFSEMEIAIFQTLADQVAISIDNARLLEESQISLKAMQRAYREKSRDDWTQLLETETELSFSYDHHKVMSIENEWRPEMEQAARTGHIVQSLDDGVANLFIPIIVRDHVVGVLNPTRPQEQGWSEDEISLLQSLAEQLGLAIDSARLYQEADRRATRERLTSEIAAKVRASNDPQTIMQTAVRELRRALRADQAQVLVRNTRLTKPGEVIPVKTTFNAGEGDNGHGRTVEEE